MTAASFVGFTSVKSQAATVVSTPPAGLQAGDHQLFIVTIGTGSESFAATPAAPAVTQIGAEQAQTGDTAKARIFYSTTVTGDVTFSKASGVRLFNVVRVAWRGGAGFDVASAQFAIRAAGASHALPTQTTTVADQKVIAVYWTDAGLNTVQTLTGPGAPWVQRYNASETTTFPERSSIGVWEQDKNPPGAVDGNVSNSLSEDGMVFTIQLAAASAPVPVVDAGADASVVVNTVFTRTGTGTNSPTSWSWTVLSGPAQVGATIGTAAALSWTPATVGAYVLRLTATNAGGTSTPDDVAVTVTAAPTAPTVSAGADVASHPVSTAFTRTATESDGGSAITSRAWTLVSAPAGVTTGAAGTTATLSYTPTVIGAYTFRYTATNAIGTSTPDDMVLTVDSTRPPGTGTVTQQWLGLDSVTVKTSGGSAVQVAFSTSSTMTSPVYSTDGTKTPDASGVTKHVMPALTADTPYWYQVESGGGPIGTAQAFRTLPGGGAQNFTFGFSSCRDHVDNFPDVNPTALADMATRGVDFFLEIGDFHYRDINTNDQPAFRTAYDELFTRSNIANTLKAIPTGYVWDDHDYGGDSSNGTTASRPAAQAVYRERVPHPTLPSATGGIYHTFVIGRVRFIMLDLRSFRSPVGNADDANKTMLGAEQKTWLQNLLNTSTEPMTVIVSSVGWIGAAGVDSGQDHWAYYTNERAQVGAWITANAAKTQCVFISGDAHMLAYDDGTNSVAGAPAYHAAALNQSTSTKGGPYSGGSRASSNAYGYVSIADTGSQISFTYSGYYDGGTLWKSHTTTKTTSTVYAKTGGAVGAAAGSGTSTRTTAAVIAKSGGAVGAGAGSGAKTRTAAAGATKAGGGTATTAGSGAKAVTTAAVHVKSGGAAGAAAGSGSRASTSAAVHVKTGGATATGAGHAPVAVAVPGGVVKTGGAAGNGTGSGAGTVTNPTGIAKTGGAAARGAGSGSRIVTVTVIHAKTGGSAARGTGSGARTVTVPRVLVKTGAAVATALGAGRGSAGAPSGGATVLLWDGAGWGAAALAVWDGAGWAPARADIPAPAELP